MNSFFVCKHFVRLGHGGECTSQPLPDFYAKMERPRFVPLLSYFVMSKIMRAPSLQSISGINGATSTFLPFLVIFKYFKIKTLIVHNFGQPPLKKFSLQHVVEKGIIVQIFYFKLYKKTSILIFLGV